MLAYDRSTSTEIEVIDRWENGFGWLAHPDEPGGRTSHAIKGEDEVWIFDPLDGPGVHDLIEDLGTVAGIVVQTKWHGRDAATFAERYDVSVHIPTWMNRVAERVDAPIERFEAPPNELVELGDSDIMVRTVDPMTSWRELIVYRPTDGTLRSADILINWGPRSVGNERIGWFFHIRFAPPRESFADIDPERILVGHGEGVFEDATEALDHALANARRNVPRAAIRQLPVLLIGMIDARIT